MTDLRYALRALAKSPGFVTVTVLSLALGSGANTAVYSAIRAVLLDALPVRAPEELVELAWRSGDAGRTGITMMGNSSFRDETTGRNYTTNFPYSFHRAFQEASPGRAELFAFSYVVSQVNVSLGTESLVGSSLLVSGSFFPALGVTTVIGRPLGELDDRPSPPGVPPGWIRSRRCAASDSEIAAGARHDEVINKNIEIFVWMR